MASLFEIQAQSALLLAEIEAAAEQGEGEITPELLAAWEQNQADAASKAEGYARAIASLEATAKEWKADAAACTARQKQCESKAALLRARLADYLLEHQDGKLSTPTYSLSARPLEKLTVSIAQGAAIPPELMKQTPDTTAIKEALIQGQQIEGCVLNMAIVPSVTLRKAGKAISEEAA